MRIQILDKPLTFRSICIKFFSLTQLNIKYGKFHDNYIVGNSGPKTTFFEEFKNF